MTNNSDPEPTQAASYLPFFLTIMLACIGGLMLIPVSNGFTLLELITNPLALNSPQLWWYANRASGLTAFLLLWLSNVWGFVVGSRLFKSILSTHNSLAFHELLSLLALGFSAAHAAVLLIDRTQPFPLNELFVPFVSRYRPIWIGVGIIAFYIMVLVTFTFYIRRWISLPVFRVIHVLSLLTYFMAAAHGLFAGTDSSVPGVLLMYKISLLVTVFLVVYWAFTTVPIEEQEMEEE